MEEWSKKYDIYAPALFEGSGPFSDTDQVRYAKVTSLEEIVFDKKSNYPFKEAILPITQVLFYFTEDEVREAAPRGRDAVIFLRSCDFNALRSLDAIYIRNVIEDHYYKGVRERAKFVVMGCESSFDNCFCVDMETNTCSGYDAYIHLEADSVTLDIVNPELADSFSFESGENAQITPKFVTATTTRVNIPGNLDASVAGSDMWDEYHTRCTSCGRCNFVCPTCTCFSMQDVSYTDNGKCGERRRVWASCQVDGFTDMAGGHSFRANKGQRTRYRVLHKVYDFKKRNGYHMCVGCGRCSDACQEYISFSACVNKLEKAMGVK